VSVLVEADRPSRPRTFAALAHRNYRLWFCGQLVSLVGTWMQTTALGFLMFELTRSPVYLGYAGFAGGAPTIFLTLYGGVISDRASRRTVLIWSQTAMMALAFTLAALTFAGVVRPWHILVLAFGLGVANAFDAPARQALVSELVEREDLTNAIALNATMFNGATAVGPAAAGLTYQWWGPGWCFAANGLSFLAVIAALSAMRIVPRARASRASAASDMLEGLRYVRHERMIRTLIATVGATSLIVTSAVTLIPAWTVRILHGTSSTNGLLVSARGIGAVVAALFVASLPRSASRGRLLTTGTFAIPVLLVAFAATTSLAGSLVLLVCLGGAVLLVNNLANALVQTQVPDGLRGRVMGVYTFVFFGAMPLGALWIGATAQQVGERIAIAVAAALALSSALTVAIREPRLRTLR